MEHGRDHPQHGHHPQLPALGQRGNGGGAKTYPTCKDSASPSAPPGQKSRSSPDLASSSGIASDFYKNSKKIPQKK